MKSRKDSLNRMDNHYQSMIRQTHKVPNEDQIRKHSIINEFYDRLLQKNLSKREAEQFNESEIMFKFFGIKNHHKLLRKIQQGLEQRIPLNQFRRMIEEQKTVFEDLGPRKNMFRNDFSL